MICKNCSNEYQGNFCNSCGQSSKQKRIDAKYLFVDIPNSILQINHGFFFTIKEMFLRPGDSIREFLEGKRKKHYKPIAFLFLTSVLYVLVSRTSGNDTFIDDFMVGIKSGGDAGLSKTAFLSWISHNQSYGQLMLLPFFALASYLAFKRSGYNYFEHFVLNAYITGQQMFIYLLFALVPNKGNFLESIPYLITFIFNILVFVNFFNAKKTGSAVGLILLTYFIFFLEILVAIFITGWALKYLF